jgi:hypothetical protein
MSGIPGSAVCPLCRQPIPPPVTGEPAGSRLCEKCRTMVESIRPSRTQSAPAPRAGLSPPGVPTQSGPGGQAGSMQPQPNGGGPAAQTSGAASSDPSANQQSAVPNQPGPMVNQPAPAAMQGVGQIPLRTVPQQPQQGGNPTTGPLQSGSSPAPRPIPNRAASSSRPGVVLVPDRPGQASPMSTGALFAGAEQGQWPIVVESNQPTGSGASKKIFVVLGLVFGVALVAGLAFALNRAGLLHLPSRQSPPVQTAVGVKAPPIRPATSSSRAATVPTPGADRPASGQPATSPAPGNSTSPASPAPSLAQAQNSPPAANPHPAAAASPPPQPVDSGSGTLTFQTASFPNQAGAEGYCQKLKDLGIPAYVVSAEIPHRGRWFRVRAGRFVTAQQAEEASAVWRARVAKAGFSLQLVSCEYEKP